MLIGLSKFITDGSPFEHDDGSDLKPVGLIKLWIEIEEEVSK